MAVIGTMRAEEARIFDAYAGYHQFHAEETQEEYGSFEIAFFDNGALCYESCGECDDDDLPGGWYWIAAFPGCMPDGDSWMGPFATSRDALEDADEWNPEFDGNDWA